MNLDGRSIRCGRAALIVVLGPLTAGSASIPAATPWTEPGPVELKLSLPAGRPGTSEPLLATGGPGHGDTIFVTYEGSGQIRFGWDSSAAGAVFSAPLASGGGGSHRLLVSMGSLLPPGTEDPTAPSTTESLLRALLLLQFDGRTVLRSPGQFQPGARAQAATLGANQVGSAILRPYFTGEILAARAVAPAQALAEAMQVARWTASFAGESARFPGAVHLRVRFPRAPAAAAEPLIVTGRTGIGDFLYAQVVDTRHLRFGFDHWAVGGMVSPAVEVDLSVVHDLVLTMDALYPPDAQGEPTPWRGQVAIWLDGHRVLSGPSACHPTTAEQIILGYNLIGGSTTGPVFRGAILEVQSVTPAELDRLGR